MRQLGVAFALLMGVMPSAHLANPSPEPQRSLTLPVVKGSEPCPITAGVDGVVPPSPHIFGGPVWFGGPPAYIAVLWGSGNRFSLDPMPIERGMRRAKTAVVSDPAYAGAIEIRGRSLRGGGAPLLFRSGGSEASETLRLMAPHVMLDSGWRGQDGQLVRWTPTGKEWSFWPVGTFIPGPGCYGMYIETALASQVVVFEAR